MKNFLHNLKQKSKLALAWLWQKLKVVGNLIVKLSIALWKGLVKLWFKFFYEELHKIIIQEVLILNFFNFDKIKVY